MDLKVFIRPIGSILLENENPKIRQICLVKGQGRYIVKKYIVEYVPGQETEVIDDLVALASGPNPDFGWFDAAVLSYQMGKRFEMD